MSRTRRPSMAKRITRPQVPSVARDAERWSKTDVMRAGTHR